jgi:hypothetical protein
MQMRVEMQEDGLGVWLVSRVRLQNGRCVKEKGRQVDDEGS